MIALPAGAGQGESDVNRRWEARRGCRSGRAGAREIDGRGLRRPHPHLGERFAAAAAGGAEV